MKNIFASIVTIFLLSNLSYVVAMNSVTPPQNTISRKRMINETFYDQTEETVVCNLDSSCKSSCLVPNDILTWASIAALFRKVDAKVDALEQSRAHDKQVARDQENTIKNLQDEVKELKAANEKFDTFSELITDVVKKFGDKTQEVHKLALQSSNQIQQLDTAAIKLLHQIKQQAIELNNHTKKIKTEATQIANLRCQIAQQSKKIAELETQTFCDCWLKNNDSTSSNQEDKIDFDDLSDFLAPDEFHDFLTLPLESESINFGLRTPQRKDFSSTIS